MPKIIDDEKKMKRGDYELFLFSGMACKWVDNRWGLLLSSVLEGMSDMLLVQRREKGSEERKGFKGFLVLKLSSLTIAAWVELILWTSVLPHTIWIESHIVRYYRIFFDLMDIACVNSYLIYTMKYSNKLSLLDYKTDVAKSLIQYHQGRKKKNQPESIDNHGGHLPDYQTMRKRCTYCAIEGKENRTFVICLACSIQLCWVKERKCFHKHHI